MARVDPARLRLDVGTYVRCNICCIPDPSNHLVCYTLRDVKPPFTARDAQTTNQFGSETLSVVKERVLCVPSTTGP